MKGGHFVVALEHQQAEELKALARRQAPGSPIVEAFIALVDALSGEKRLYQAPGGRQTTREYTRTE